MYAKKRCESFASYMVANQYTGVLLKRSPEWVPLFASRKLNRKMQDGWDYEFVLAMVTECYRLTGKVCLFNGAHPDHEKYVVGTRR